MTTNYHTPIAFDADADSSAVNNPLADLDEQIGINASDIATNVTDIATNTAQLVTTLENIGSARSTGALVVLGVAAGTFDITTTPGDPDARYVLMEDIANGASGKVAVTGYATVLVEGTVVVGDMLGASATAGRAEARSAGSGFGVALTANASGSGSVIASVSPVVFAAACNVFSNAILTTTTGVDETIFFESETYDTDGMHSTSANQDLITINSPGFYSIKAFCNIDVAAGENTYSLKIFQNGAQVVRKINRKELTSTAGSLSLNANYEAECAVGDYFQVKLNQGSGGNLDTVSPQFAFVHKIGN